MVAPQMPMVQPITAYDARRKSKRAARFSLPPEHMVYVALVGDSGLVKIGRTKNISQRSGGHSHETGQTCRYIAQMVVQTPDDAKLLERHAIAIARGTFEGVKREWFRIADDQLPGFVAKVVAGPPVEITEQRGSAGAVDETPVRIAYAHEAISAARATRIRLSSRTRSY